MTLALIDYDLLVYEYAGITKEDGTPQELHLCKSLLFAKIDDIVRLSGADSHVGYLTGSGNFREHIATIKPYKGNRAKHEKPEHYTAIREILINRKESHLIHMMEADDALSIHQNLCNNDKNLPMSILCSRDKDLDMVPGWHYSWSVGKAKEKKAWLQDKIGGLRCFYKQLLTGDTVDNIPGLFGVGAKSSLLETVQVLTTEWEMFDFVRGHYIKRFGSYAEQFLLENGRLLWMLRTEGDLWEFPDKVGHGLRPDGDSSYDEEWVWK